MNTIISLFKKPSAKTIAQRDLEDYQRKLLEAQATAAYATKMVEYYQEGIGRLQKAVK